MEHAAYRRRRKSGPPKSAAEAIQELIHRLGITRTIKQYDVINTWESIVGERIAKVTTVQRIDNGVLYISVATAPWRAELSMKRTEIIEKINRAVGRHIVREIRFR